MSKQKNESKVAGAAARAASLTPEQRSEIARKAAAARWKNGVPEATHTGELFIGNIAIPCHVLEDGSRVISGRGIQNSLGFSKSSSGLSLSNFIESKLIHYLSPEVIDRIENPFVFKRIGSGGSAPTTHGYDAGLLIDICDATIEAFVNKKLNPSQYKYAEHAQMIIRSVAKVGIIALVDEATGYQEVRDKQALQAILDKYLAKELAAWAKRFPDDFYKEMFRLKGWDFTPANVAKPGVVGLYTNQLVYERLAYGLVEELQKKNPKNESGNRKAKHHQWLTSEIGHPALAQHLHSTIGFMKFCSNWDQFIDMMDRVYPRKGHTIPLNLE